MPTIEKLKEYLGIDGSYSDSLVADFLETAKELVEKILRYKIVKNKRLPSLVNEALTYAVSYLYSNRENSIEQITPVPLCYICYVPLCYIC